MKKAMFNPAECYFSSGDTKCDFSGKPINLGEPYIEIINGKLKIRYQEADGFIDSIKEEDFSYSILTDMKDIEGKCNLCFERKNDISFRAKSKFGRKTDTSSIAQPKNVCDDCRKGLIKFVEDLICSLDKFLYHWYEAGFQFFEANEKRTSYYGLEKEGNNKYLLFGTKDSLLANGIKEDILVYPENISDFNHLVSNPENSKLKKFRRGKALKGCIVCSRGCSNGDWIIPNTKNRRKQDGAICERCRGNLEERLDEFLEEEKEMIIPSLI